MKIITVTKLDKVYKWIRDLRKTASDDNMHPMRLLAENIYFMVFHGLTPNYYNTAGFYQKKIAWDIKKRHLSPQKYQKFNRKVNNKSYLKLIRNKLCEKALLELLCYPTPKYLGFLNPVSGRAADGVELQSRYDLSGYLSRLNIDKICFKKVEGWGGAGFIAAEIIRTENDTVKLKPLNGRRALSVDDFYLKYLAESTREGVLIESYLEQHDTLKRLNPSSVNTIRVWVVKNLKGRSARVVGAFVRIGREGSLVDNTDAGGFLCQVDLITGRLNAGEKLYNKAIQYEKHPDHGSQITNTVIPYWEETMDLCRRVILSFPNIGFAGVDIAIGCNGPVIIELNAPPDSSGGIQFNFCTRDLLIA